MCYRCQKQLGQTFYRWGLRDYCLSCATQLGLPMDPKNLIYTINIIYFLLSDLWHDHQLDEPALIRNRN